MELAFKLCSVLELETLCQISLQTFVEAFEKDNNPADFNSYVTNAFSSVTLKKQLDNPNTDFYFVLVGEQLVGYLKLNVFDAQSEKIHPNAMELERIYVVQDFQNKGYGQKILNKVLEIAKTQNKQLLWLGVWEQNVAAIRFYERNGFRKFDTHPYYIGNDKQTDWLMKIDLIN